MNAEEYVSTDARGLGRLLARGEVQPSELQIAAVQALAEANAHFNFLAYRAPLSAIPSAVELGLLTGVPTLMKDINGHLAGLPMTFGSRLFEGRSSPRDTHVGACIRTAGMNVLGLSAAPEFSLEGYTENRLSGIVRNPWDARRTPGGSSGGAAAAVASGAVPVAHGSDIAGSIRVPASWCGLVGLKPSRGLISSGPDKDEGGFGLASNQFLARTVRDCAATLDMLARRFPGDPFDVPRPSGSYLDALRSRPPAGLRIAFSTCGRMGVPVDAEMVAAVEHVASTLAAEGGDVRVIQDPLDGLESLLALTDIWLAGFAEGLDRWSGASGRPLDETTLDVVALAACERSRGIAMNQFLDAVDHLNRLRRQVGAALQGIDIWITPTTPGPAPEIASLERISAGEPFSAHVERMMAPVFQHTAVHNITGMPALSLPLGRTRSSLPLGVQLSAPHGRDAGLLQLAAFLEAEMPWPLTAPRSGTADQHQRRRT